jgi:hypothetical protein
MSETHSGDEELETADDEADQVSETSTGDDAAHLPLQLSARLDALEACTVELLRCFDESKRNMDRYYHAFLELETVVNQLAENQNRLTEFVQSAPGAAGVGPSGAPAGAAGGAAGGAHWRGKACPHGRRPYRCRHCAAGAAPRGAAPRGAQGEPDGRVAAHAQLASDLHSLKARIAQITRPGARPAL